MKLIRPLNVLATGSFTRASTGTYYDYTGTIKTASNNVPRFSFNPSALTMGSRLLLESAATNLVLYSEQFDNAAWISVGSTTVTPNTGVAPDGNTTADLLAGTGGSSLRQNVAISSNTTYTFSVYVKSTIATTMSLFMSTVQNSLTPTNILTQSFTLVPGWQRVAMSITSLSLDNVLQARVVLDSSGDAMYVWGAQIEAGVNATSYIPTTSASVTRAADVNSQYMISDVLENDAPLWNSATTYPLGALALDSVSHHVFSSTGPNVSANLLQSPSVVKSQSITVSASSCTLSFYGTGSITLSGTATGTLTGTGSSAQVQLTVTATSGTVILTVTGTCTDGIFQSGAAVANTNNPIPNTTWWIDTGASNRWRVFDGVTAAQTVQANEFSVALTPGNRFDSVVGLNCSAQSCAITVVDPVYGLVYNELVNLVALSGISDLYAYFYEPIVQQNDFSVTDIPPTFAASTITITFYGATAACGEIVVGLSKELGLTDWTAQAAIIDYSVKTQDAFGNYTIVQRNFSKQNTYTVQVPTATLDVFYNLMEGYRATPIVYLGSNSTLPQIGQATPEGFQSLIVYGYYTTFTAEATDIAYSTVSLVLESIA